VGEPSEDDGSNHGVDCWPNQSGTDQLHLEWRQLELELADDWLAFASADQFARGRLEHQLVHRAKFHERPMPVNIPVSAGNPSGSSGSFTVSDW